jgi:hypothetical protein
VTTAGDGERRRGSIVRGRGGLGGSKMFRGAKEWGFSGNAQKVGGTRGGGYPFLGQGERRNGVKLNTNVFFTTFLTRMSKKFKRPIWAYFWHFVPTFCVFRNLFFLFLRFLEIFLLYKASDKRVGALFLGRMGGSPPPLLILTCGELCEGVNGRDTNVRERERKRERE